MTGVMEKGDLCLVTGISGYLATWVGKYLLEEGYQVRGTVRSVNNLEQITKLREILPGATFVEADLRKAQGWTEAVEDVKWVFHVASPQAVPTEKDRTGGATMGTEFLMNAALNSVSVKKIVVTSSEAAIAYGHPSQKLLFTEDDWTNVEVASADYMRSKTLAEQLAWRIAGDSERNPRKIPLSTVCPGAIMGPSLIPWGRYSSETLKNLAVGKTPFVFDMISHYVDVRDCARMHIAIMGNPQTNGHRHFSFSTKVRLQEVPGLIRRYYGHLGFKPAPFKMPKWVLRIMRMFNSDVDTIYSKIGTTPVYQTKYPNVYRYRYTDAHQMLKDTMDSMLAHRILIPPSSN
ncbi:3-beta hydroxysteroid dehydrogenase/isomerase family protein [compost metagenome]